MSIWLWILIGYFTINVALFIFAFANGVVEKSFKNYSFVENLFIGVSFIIVGLPLVSYCLLERCLIKIRFKRYFHTVEDGRVFKGRQKYSTWLKQPVVKIETKIFWGKIKIKTINLAENK